ncbi:MAG: glutaminyl-peptide cyclotransferase [Gammaproteobacteria bacterium]
MAGSTSFIAMTTFLQFYPTLFLCGFIATADAGIANVRTVSPDDERCAVKSAQLPENLSYEIIGRLVHDPEAFTQGLLLYQGKLYESTGLWGQSSLRELDRKGNITRSVGLSRYTFGEGLAMIGGKLVQLTWKSGQAFIYRPDSLQLIGQFDYTGEGWGATTVEGYLVVSDGSSRLRFLEPKRFETVRSLTVRLGPEPLSGLNELEYAQGLIFANVWPSDFIVAIDPENGRVVARLDLADLYPSAERPSDDAVLNGIAYDADRNIWLVTGKNWPYIFEITLQGHALNKSHGVEQ